MGLAQFVLSVKGLMALPWRRTGMSVVRCRGVSSASVVLPLAQVILRRRVACGVQPVRSAGILMTLRS